MSELLRSGIDVEYWDLSNIFFKERYEQEDSSHLTKTIIFLSYQDIEIAVQKQNLDKTLFISIVTYEGRVIKLFRLLTKYNCKLAVFGRNMFPIADLMKYHLIKRLYNLSLLKLINYINNKNAILLKRLGWIKSYDILFQGGSQGWKGIGLTCKNEIYSAQIINLNSDDYDVALIQKNRERIIHNEYILFLDEFLPLHPDTRLFGLKTVEADHYYKELNKYFDKVEKQFNMPVVIAAHPKAYAYKERDFFCNRQVIYNESAILSRDAVFVLAHDSTSINYPVAYGTLLHFITSHEIEKIMYFVHKNILTFANYLSCNWQYFDNENELVNITEKLPINAYKKYKYDFQCSEDTVSRLSSDIVVDFFRRE